MAQCDICNGLGKVTVVKAQDMSNAVLKGFDPFEKGLADASMILMGAFGLAGSGPEAWKQSAILGVLSDSDWNVCANCMKEMKPYMATVSPHHVTPSTESLKCEACRFEWSPPPFFVCKECGHPLCASGNIAVLFAFGLILVAPLLLLPLSGLWRFVEWVLALFGFGAILMSVIGFYELCAPRYRLARQRSAANAASHNTTEGVISDSRCDVSKQVTKAGVEQGQNAASSQTITEQDEPLQMIVNLSTALTKMISQTPAAIRADYDNVKHTWESTFLAEGNKTEICDLIYENLKKYASWKEYLGMQLSDRQIYAQINVLFGRNIEAPEYALTVRVWKSNDIVFACGSSDFTRDCSMVDCPVPSQAAVPCLHCSELFDHTKAQRHHTDIGDWIICPHCRKEAQDNIHLHCPYWSDWRCRHDPKHVTYCSLPTKAPYETCALL
jgi:hypothetical protein